MNYEKSAGGVFMPQINIGGMFHGQIVRDGRVIDEWEDHNTVVNEGLNALLDIMFHGTTQITTVGTDGPSPHLLTGIDVSYGDSPVEDTLSGSLRNVAALTVDVGRAGLSDAPALDIAGMRKCKLDRLAHAAQIGKPPKVVK